MKSFPRSKLVIPLLVASLLLPAGVSSAASIDWGLGPITISGDSDVSTDGSLLAAYNFGAGTTGTTVINGVTFDNVLPTNFTNSAPSVTVGTGAGSLTIASSTLLSANVFGTGSTPYASLSAPYRALLESSVWNDSGGNRDITFTINDLTPGQQYQIQIWVNDARSYGVTRTTTFTAGNSVVIDQNTGSGDGGVGQFAIGTFTADSTTQTFVGSSGASTNLSGYLIAAVPEPRATGATMGLALLALIALRRSGMNPGALARRRSPA